VRGKSPTFGGPLRFDVGMVLYLDSRLIVGRLAPLGGGTRFTMDQSPAPLADALADYHRSNRYGFTPPGHRQGAGVDDRVLVVMGKDPFRNDVLAALPVVGLPRLGLPLSSFFGREGRRQSGYLAIDFQGEPPAVFECSDQILPVVAPGMLDRTQRGRDRACLFRNDKRPTAFGKHGPRQRP
jgi:hypothetical protein